MSPQESLSTPRPRRPRTNPRRYSVLVYLVILFAVAFLLLLWAYFQQQRANTESTDALKQSASAVQSIQNLIDENAALREENQALKEQMETMETAAEEARKAISAAQAHAEGQEASIMAMDYFWQIDEAYVRQRYNLCRQLIQELKDVGLEEALPGSKATDNDRYSPLERYNEIYNALY